ncbi:MAG: MFS transporter [Proteobacteria bacterium]|nr:MFS transporter [Pseudomonadota bacterium]
MTSQQRSMIAVFASLSVAALIYGLTMPLLALVLEKQGVGDFLIGLSTATQFLAVIAVAPVTPWLLKTIGPARLILYGTLATVVLFLLLRVFFDVYAWFPLRFAMGVAAGLLWVAGEAWVNQITEDHVRGRVVAAFNLVIAGGFALGPTILILTGIEGWLPFIVSAAIMAVAAAPLLLSLGVAPKFEGRPSARLPRFLILAPVAMFVCLAFAAVEGVLVSFLSIYGMHVGLSQEVSISLITVMGLGGMAVQLPVGWLADRMDRRLLTSVCAFIALIGLLLMPVAVNVSIWKWPYIFLLGGALAALYTLGMVLLGERFKDADLAAATALFGVMWGVGSVIGPPLGGIGIELWDPHGMPVAVALMLAVFLPLPVIAYIRRRRSEALSLGS